MSKQTITAFFDARSHAEHAAPALKQAGLPAGDVSVSPETARDDLATAGKYAGATGPKKTGSGPLSRRCSAAPMITVLIQKASAVVATC